jgi:hypothetical protein
MCKINNQYCEDIVKWYSPKKCYRLYCKAHGFKNQPYLTDQEVCWFRSNRPDLISADDPWNMPEDPIQRVIVNHFSHSATQTHIERKKFPGYNI